MSQPYITGNSIVPGGAGTGPAEVISPKQTASGHDDDGQGGAPARRKPRGRALAKLGLGLIVPVVLLAAWQLAAITGLISPVTLPAPTAVFNAAVDLIQRGELRIHIAISTQRVVIGFLIGAVAGLAIGAFVGLSRWVDTLFSPTIGAIRAVPSLAWVPLLLLWVGIGEDSKVILIAIGAFFPVFTTVAMALQHVDRNLVEAGRAFGLNGVRLFTTVQLPAVVPSVISGLRLALAQAWLFLVAAELLASSMGLGFLLTDSQNNGRVDRLLLTIVLLAVLGKLTDGILGVFEKWAIRRWA